jgi:cell division protein ZapB
MCPAMQKHNQQNQLDQVTERVERLLVRHLELQRTNALLAEQLAAMTHERDSLKSRLGAARARVDALLERLPETMTESMTETMAETSAITAGSHASNANKVGA